MTDDEYQLILDSLKNYRCPDPAIDALYERELQEIALHAAVFAMHRAKAKEWP
jgi:hypothetical protein